MRTAIGMSPVVISQILDDSDGGANGPGLGFGETRAYPAFRHEYAMPYLLDEITIGPIDTTVDWQIMHGGIALAGSWMSPYTMCRRLSQEEQQISQPLVQDLSTPGLGLSAVLQWKLLHPMLVMPNEQITVTLKRQPGVADINQGPLVVVNPVCVLRGRSLNSDYQAPARKVVPYAVGFRHSLGQAGLTAPNVQTYQNDDGELSNSTPQDVKLDRFAAVISMDANGVRNGQPIQLPAKMSISDSEGGFIAKDFTDFWLLGNGQSRIWDVKGTLRHHQFWTTNSEVDLSTVAVTSGHDDYAFSLLVGLVGYRQIDNTQPMDLTGNYYAKPPGGAP